MDPRGRRPIPTLRTIADALGVHPSTVSRSLHPEHSRRISADTVMRVRSVAHELGYEPDPWARSLRTKRTRTLGFLVPSFKDAPLATMLDAAEDRARESGYIALILSTHDRAGEQGRLGGLLLDRRVDGLILATATIDDPSLDELASRGVPLVLMNRASGDIPVVRGDDELGGYLATRHLLARGHKRVGLISGWTEVSTAHLRRLGYLRALAEFGLPSEDELIGPSTFSAESGYEAAGRLLSGPHPPSAIFAVNDPTAIGAMAAARDCGLMVPDDLAVIGYNDSELAAMLPVPLSSVALPLPEIGQGAVDVLLAALRGETTGRDLLPPRLVVRASTGDTD